MPAPLRVVLAAAVLALLAVPSAAGAKTVWLCKPGIANNPCTSSLSATVVSADGTRRVERARPARRAPIDCFYVYPTVSGQPRAQATKAKDPEIRAVARYQASRFSQRCRVFAPMYRQITVAGLSRFADPELRATAYGDIREAWRTYLRRHNRGRGVVLLGHSQGTFLLRDLIRREIDRSRSARRRLVSALLLGGNLLVKRGSDRGGDFRAIRACRAPGQTGCVVAYSAYDAEPPSTAIFARAPAPGLETLCTNPASLRGGPGSLDTYAGARSAVATPWVAYPNRYVARCRSAGSATWLHVEPTGGAADTRPVERPFLGPAWGLHAVDLSLAMGNLVDLVRRQGAAHLRRR